MIGPHYARLIVVLLILGVAIWWMSGAAAFSVGAQQQDVPPELIAYADMVLYNGKILTANDRFALAEAIAVRDGRFLSTGRSEQILKMAGPETRRVDLQGKTVAPGFIDTHQHLHDYARRGEERVRIDFEKDKQRALQELERLVGQAGRGEWMFVTAAGSRGAPLSGGRLLLSRKELDAVAPGNPVAVAFGPLAYVVNSAALQSMDMPPDALGLDKDSQTGQPTGWIEDEAASILEYEGLPWEPLEKLIPLLQAEMLRENGAGLTTVCTRVPGNHMTALKEIWSRGELTMRWRINHEMLAGNRKAEAYLKRVGNLDGFGDHMMKISGLYVNPPDGLLGSGRAWTTKPMLHVPPESEHLGSFGKARWLDERSDGKTAILGIRYGWSVLGMHSAGDAANSAVLAAYEEGKSKPIVVNPRQRLGLDHGPMLTAEHIQKMKRLGVIPSVGMKYIFAGGTDKLVYLYGADAVSQMTPLRSVIEMGVKPVSEADTGQAPDFHPLWQMEKALTRRDEKGRLWGAEEKITRQQALWMYTNWAAYYTGDERYLGTIEPGKLADFVVLDGDLMEAPEDRISEIPVVMTAVGGRIVYEK